MRIQHREMATFLNKGYRSVHTSHQNSFCPIWFFFMVTRKKLSYRILTENGAKDKCRALDFQSRYVSGKPYFWHAFPVFFNVCRAVTNIKMLPHKGSLSQGNQGRFLVNKTATVAARSPSCRSFRRSSVATLYSQNLGRPQSCWSYLSWWPCFCMNLNDKICMSARVPHTVILEYFNIKFIYSEKATKILWNLPLTFDYSTYGQKLGEDFAKFCGLLRIYELYNKI